MFQAALACVGVLGLAAGGVRTWTVAGLALVALVSCALVVYARPLRLAPVHLLLLAAACWQTALLIPLPPALAKLLSPAYAETRAFVWEALSPPPRWGPLATNPAVAALDAARTWATLLLVIVVADRARRNQSTKLVALSIVVTGLLQMAFGGFINPNHQAAFWNIAWITALCATFFVREQWLRAALSVASAALLVGVATTGSRAGVIAGALGGMVLGWRLRHDVGRRAGVIAFFLALALIVGAGLAGERVASEMRLRAEEKTRVWARALSIVSDYPFGTGRAGFALVFPSVREPDRERGRWDYVENEYIQTLVDYGPLGGTCGLLGFAWLLFQLSRKTRWRVETAGVSAIVVALGAHAVFDFNWELAGVFVPVWLLIATLARPNNHAFAAAAFDKVGVSARAVFMAAALALPALLSYGLLNDPARLTAEQLVVTRPLDSWAHVTLATEAMHKNQPQQALRWLNRAVLVDRDWKQPHIALARLFCASGRRAQGRLELKLADDRSGDDGRDPAAIPLLLRCTDAPGDELDMGERALPAVISALMSEKNDASLRAIAAQYSGDDPAVFVALCTWARGRPEWAQLLARWPSSDSAGLQRERAEQALLAGDTETALQLFSQLYQADERIAQRYVELLIANQRLDEAVLANASTSVRDQHLNRARIAAKRHKSLEAVSLYRSWLSRAPKDITAITEAAHFAQSVGDKDAAIDILQTGLRAGDSAELRAQLKALAQ